MQIIPDPLFAAIMTIPFLVTLVALNVILVKPMREYLEGRDGAIHGARKEAAELDASAEAKLSELEARLTTARQEAAQVRADHRRRGLENEREILSAARAKAEAEVTAALAIISGEAESARTAIGQTAKNLSVDIAGRVLGRGLGA
jgi:F-type H+-transporting ATPase subunit b